MCVDEPCDRMIMEYMSPGGHGLISIGHQGNVSGNEECTAGTGKKKRKKKSIAFHIIYVSAISSGLLLFWGVTNWLCFSSVLHW